jgi:hypothetical protein
MSRCPRLARPMALNLDRRPSEILLLEVFDRGPVQDPAFVVEARSVTGAVPALLGTVPRHDASAMRAGGRDRVQLAVFVAVARDLAGTDVLDYSFSRSEVVEGSALGCLTRSPNQ